MSKFKEIQAKWPDAKEYYERNQHHVSEAEARVAVYGTEVKAKCLFDRSINRSTCTVQQYIFSEKAAEQTGNGKN